MDKLLKRESVKMENRRTVGNSLLIHILSTPTTFCPGFKALPQTQFIHISTGPTTSSNIEYKSLVRKHRGKVPKQEEQ